MRTPEAGGLELRVLILAPTARDASTSSALLAAANVQCDILDSIPALCREARKGAAALLLTDGALTPQSIMCLTDLLSEQPAWSDLPILILTPGGVDYERAAPAFETLGNVTLLDRPVRVAMFVSAVRTAIRSRQRQYQIREHVAEQESARDALRDNDHRKDEFLAMLAHELRNPLASVISAAAVIRLRGVSDPLLRRQHEVIERQSDQMARLLDDLLNVSRITQGRIELRREIVDLVALTEDAAANAVPTMEERQHLFEVSLPTSPLYLNADPTRLVQVLANLLTNAAKYTPPGGSIYLAVTEEGSEAVVRVRDSGLGIAPDLLPHVFDLFTQAERTLARSEGGLGLGLTMVKRLVEMHAGTATAYSDGAGMGSEFVVRLPLYIPALAAEPDVVQPSISQKASDSPRRVLVVEDNRDAAESLSTLLELWGHQVEVAGSGEEGIQLAPKFQPDVVLLDIGLPGMDGYEAAERLRSELELDGARIIALTGYGQQADRQRAAKAGFQRHLTKPVDPDILRELIAGLADLTPSS